MQLTDFGWVLLPLCVAFCLYPDRLLQLVFVASVFGAAAAFVFRGFGFPPGLPPAVVFMGYVVLQYALGVRYPAEREVWRLLEPMALAVVYALATAIILPRLFNNAFYVWPQKVDTDFAMPVPLGPSAANITQSLYLLSNFAMLALAAVYVTRTGFSFRKLLDAYFAGAVIVLGISFWQVLSREAGIWYPETFLYSNPGWVIFPAQTLGGVPRTNGPFSEPAALAAYLGGVIYACTWVLLRGHKSRVAQLVLPGSVIGMFLCTSTTGYAVVAIGAGLLILYGMTRAPRRVAARLFAIGIPLLALSFLGLLMLIAMQPSIGDSVAEVLNETLNKSQSSSYDDRTSTDVDSLWVVVKSYGLGAGFGSVRSSSLGPGLLANFGLVGVVPVIWFGLRLTRRLLRARAATADPQRLLVIDAFSGHAVGMLVSAAVSAPMITAIDFFLVVAVLMGCTARIENELGHRRRARVAASSMRIRLGAGAAR